MAKIPVAADQRNMRTSLAPLSAGAGLAECPQARAGDRVQQRVAVREAGRAAVVWDLHAPQPERAPLGERVGVEALPDPQVCRCSRGRYFKRLAPGGSARPSLTT